MKKICLIVSLVLCFSMLTSCTKEEALIIPTDNQFGLRDNIEDGAILHCFSWSFQTIEESLEDIALAGYSAIQTSPINACYDGGTGGNDLYGQGRWYYHYQPTDWKIGNYQLGTRDEFKSMCAKAEQYGIKVIVDVAPNHTTKETDEIAQDLIDAVGGTDNLYHDNGLEEIVDYTDRAECTLQAVSGLYDVNTENKDFQDYFIAFLNDCIACGADGFRYDTAKHIGLSDDPQEDENLPNNFWERVTTEIDNVDNIFMYGEVLQDGSERLADYIDVIGATTASDYGAKVRAGFNTTTLKAEPMANLKIGEAKENIVTWVESHDNYTGSDATFASLTNEEIKLAYSYITARSKGTPLFFSRPYNADEKNKWGTFNKIGMVGDNLYKDDTVVCANHFRNAMVGLDENVINPSDKQSVICIERGTKGIFLINAGVEDYTFNMETNLEDAEYINRYDNTTKYSVKNGVLTGTLPAKEVAALYNEGYVEVNDNAIVKVSDDTMGHFSSDTLEVTLETINSVKSYYSIDGSDKIEFKDGDVITIGKGIERTKCTDLTLYGENNQGNQTCITYTFKKQNQIQSGTKVYFEKPDDWADNIYAYVYDETSSSSVKENNAWPGIAMKKEDNGLYSYTFDEEWGSALIIFTDGTNQSNGVLEPGEEVVSEKVYKME